MASKKSSAASTPSGQPPQPETLYRDSMAHLADEMRALKLLIALRVHELRKEHALSPSEYRGMFLADHEVRAFLGEAQEDVGPLTDINVSRERYIEITRAMSNRVQRSLDAGVYLALPILMHRFSLHPMELKVLLLGLAVDLDQNFKRIFAFVQNRPWPQRMSAWPWDPEPMWHSRPPTPRSCATGSRTLPARSGSPAPP